jgi:segregation and condensation protein B
MTERLEMEAVVEAILFVANDPVPRQKLLEVFSENEAEEAERAIEAVIERYREDPVRGVLVDEVAGGLRLVSRPDLHGYLRRFFEVTGSNKLTMAALETLAIVAYRQPITAPEIQELRSVNSSGVLKTLLERRLIRIAGRKEVVGKPFLYTTTRDFLMHFGLRSLKELPPLEQFDELFGPDAEPAEGEAGPDSEEEILREVAEIEEEESEAADRDEAERIEAERAAAEAQQAEEEELAEVAAGDDGEEPGEEPEAEEPAAEEPESEEPEATEEPAAEESEGEEPAAEEPEDEEPEAEAAEAPVAEAAEEPADEKKPVAAEIES